MFNKLQRKLAQLALYHLDSVVYNYIDSNPGKRCFEIDNATLKSHHQWGTKHILTRLEQQGYIFVVKREFLGTMQEPGKNVEYVYKKVPPRYYTYTY